MHYAAANLLRIAADIESSNPLLAYELSRHTRGLVAVINPEAEKFEQRIERVLGVLKSMRQEMQKALNDYETAEEFAKFFKEGLPEEEELVRLVSASRIALPDWLKRKKKPENDEPSGMSPSYKISPEEEESFVEGKHELEPGKAIEKEKHNKDEFMSGVEDVTHMFEKAKKGKPGKGPVKVLLKAINNLIDSGSKLIEGWKKAPKKEEKKPFKAPPKPGGKKSPVPDLKGKVEHYTDLLQRNLDDESKVMSVLKEFFNTIKPVVEEERATISSALPILIRTAHTHFRTRKALLPLIQKLAAR
jgi:hypothetical protein